MTMKQIAVRLPRLLDKNLNEVRRLRPRAQNIELNITPLSTASLMLEDGSGVGIRSFVELYNAKGSVGIYRVSRPDESYGNGERLTLEHGICVLDDAVVSGRGEIEGTPNSVLSEILTYQTTRANGQNLWTLGKVEAPNSMTIAVEHDGTKTLEILMKAMSKLAGYMLTFDQSVFPWVVNVVKKPENVACEGRLSRNIRTIRKTMDDSELCTRLYCEQLDGGYIESDTIDTWGEVEKSITLNDDMSESDVQAYCRRYLENRKNPILAVEVDATEWFAMTGERLDRFEIGDLCRITMPEYGVVIEERIVAMNYMDVLGMPEAVTVSLANQIADLSIQTARTQQDVDSLKNTSTRYGDRITSSETNITNLKDAQEGFKEVDNKMLHWFSSVEVNLDATEEAAIFGALASYKQVSATEVRITEAELTLYGDGTSAKAGLVARVDDNEASITATATELGSEIKLKADITYVDKLVADEIDSAFADLKITDAETIVTEYLTVKDKATINALALDGNNIKLSDVTVLTSGTTLTVNASGGVVTGVVLNRATKHMYYLDWD